MSSNVFFFCWMHSPPKYKGLLGVDNHGDRLWGSEVNASEGIPAEVPLVRGTCARGGVREHTAV